MDFFGRKSRALAVGALAVAMTLGVGATGAAANSTPLGSTPILETPESWLTCSAPLIESPYSPLGDAADYVLAPGGSFEEPGLPGWQLPAGASVISGDDAFTANDSLLTAHVESKLLEIKAGTSVISPAMCVDLNYPHFRFTSSALLNLDGAEIQVEVVYPNAENPAFEELTHFDGRQGDYREQRYRVSQEIALKPETGGQQWGGRLMALRITALSGTWRIDDVYVDPRFH